MSAVIYRRHGATCTSRRHRTWEAVVRCLWPWITEVVGRGEYAVLVRCSGQRKVILGHRDPSPVMASGWQCDPHNPAFCNGHHRAVVIHPDLLGDKLVQQVLASADQEDR